MEKANYRRRNSNEKFVFPYDLGFWNNIHQVLTFNCQPVGDGINWPIKRGCDKYDLTVSTIYYPSIALLV